MLRIYAPFNYDDNACSWYRVEQPLKIMSELKLAQCFFDDDRHALDNDRGTARAISSLMWYYKSLHRQFQGFVEDCAKLPPQWMKQQDGEWEWDCSPTMVMDTDDDDFNVPPSIVGAFRRVGTKGVDGKHMKAGDAIGATDPEGRPMLLHEDGKDGFDVKRNFSQMSQLRTNYSVAGIVTCSNDRLEARVLEEVPTANTYVLPNCIDLREFFRIDHAESDRVKLLWQGGDSHHECIEEVRDVYKRIHDDFPEVDFQVWGPRYEALWKGMDRVEFIDYVPFTNFYTRLNAMGHDIALAPLSKHIFNNSRTPIKMYESAACWKPAPVVAANYGPFKAEVIHGETGMLYDSPEEHYAALAELIQDKRKRRELAANAKDWCKTNRDPVPHIRAFVDYALKQRETKKALTKTPQLPEELARELVSAK